MIELLDYLGGLEVSQGRLSGEPLTVFPWQRRFIRGAFRKGVTSAALSVARANGKTCLTAGIAAATLDGPLTVPRSETVLVASSFEQARIGFEHVLAFMADSCGTGAVGRYGTRRNKRGSRIAKPGRGCAVSGAIRAGRMGSRRALSWRMSPRSGRGRPGSGWLPRSGPLRASSRRAVSSRSGRARRMPRTGSQRCSRGRGLRPNSRGAIGRPAFLETDVEARKPEPRPPPRFGGRDPGRSYPGTA